MDQMQNWAAKQGKKFHHLPSCKRPTKGRKRQALYRATMRSTSSPFWWHNHQNGDTHFDFLGPIEDFPFWDSNPKMYASRCRRSVRSYLPLRMLEFDADFYKVEANILFSSPCDRETVGEPYLSREK